jgi:threonine/homoserine/homoserine lactone efflux protein
MISSFIPFIIFLFFWNVSPGPMVMLVSRNSVKYSFKGGFPIICGILMCDLIYLALAFFGVSEFILKHERIFFYAKILGGCYIFYIGLTILWDSRKIKDYTSNKGVSSKFNFKKEVMKGFFTNLSNPFTIVGMTSFILPFFKPEMTLEAKALFAFLIPFSTLYCFTIVTIIFGNSVIRNLIMPKIIWFERLAGLVICYMAFDIILTVFQ